jgi:adenosylcobinamide-GDP ribazoletransferase
MPDSLRLAVGTLTAIRVPAPRRVTPTVAGRAMLLAPLVGVLLGLAAAAVLDGIRFTASLHRPSTVVDLLGAVLALATLAWLTRGLHLDGLADTADGLGVKVGSGGPDGSGGPGAAGGGDAALERTRERRLAVMREPDVGAFGVVTIVLVLLVQAVALTACVLAGFGTDSLVVAVTVGRLAATWACTTSVPSARPEGLGATVAGSVPRAAALAVTVAVLLGVVLLGRLDDDASRSAEATLVTASLVGLLAGMALLRRCVTRFGGVTGDVLGAVVEVTTTTVLVVVAVALGLQGTAP